MECDAVEKIISIAKKNPKILLSPEFFKKIGVRLGISSEETPEKMIFSYEGRVARTAIITADNCTDYKCIVKEGKTGIMIYEFINALIVLLNDEKIPPSPHDKMGQTAEYYCKRGIEILSKRVPGQSK